jgi:hypothetical protein
VDGTLAFWIDGIEDADGKSDFNGVSFICAAAALHEGAS